MGCLAKSQVRIPSGLGEAQWPQHVVPALWSGNRSNSRCQDAGTWTWTLCWKELLCHSHKWDSTSHKEGVHMSLLWLKGITCPAPPQKKHTWKKMFSDQPASVKSLWYKCVTIINSFYINKPRWWKCHSKYFTLLHLGHPKISSDFKMFQCVICMKEAWNCTPWI